MPKPDKARSLIIGSIVRLLRPISPDYTYLKNLFKDVRKALELKAPSKARKLPHLLTDSQIESFYNCIDKAQNIKHQIMLRLLLFTGLRVSELCKIKLEDVDLAGSKIYIEQGKGSKDRYVLFPSWFALALQAHLASNPKGLYLFESKFRKGYSTRRIQQLVAEYASEAGIEIRVHPHLMRHQLLTYLTKHGMRDTQIQLISGHASRDSLAIYQHMGLADVEEAYQSAMKQFKGV